MATFYTFKGRVRRWRRYRVTVGELAALSPRALNDLGINRFEIHQVSRHAAKIS